jgi:hypothetical protein
MSEPAFERLGRGYSRSMTAAVRMRCVPSDVVRIIEVDKPVPKDDEVLVKVASARRSSSGS